jgi:ABC-type multidrug transport system fused ATPase/permease subunit
VPFWKNSIRSFKLLNARQKRLYCFALILQSSLGVLDLVGVLLSGLIGVVATKSLSENSQTLSLSRIEDLPLIRELSDVQFLTLLSASVFIFFLLKTVLSLIFSKRVFKFLANQQSDLSTSIYQNLFKRDNEWLDSANPMDIANSTVIGSAMATVNSLGQTLIIISEVSLLLFFGIIFLVLNPILSLITIAYTTIIILILNQTLSKKISEFGERLGQLRVQTQSRILETLRLRKEILILGREEFFKRDISDTFKLQSSNFSGDIWLQQTPKYILEISLLLGTFGFIGFLTLTENQAQGIQLFVVFLAASSRIFPSILRIQTSILNLRSFNYLSGSAMDLQERLEQSCVNQSPITISANNSVEPKIIFKNVSFTYPNSSKSIFHEFNCEVGFGEKVALIGGSGAGKSTFIQMILGFRTAGVGSVEINKEESRSWIANNPSRIGYVPQDYEFISGTLLENICLGIKSDSVDYSRVADALKKAHLTNFVASLPQGLNTFLGQNGENLSGGQKQRIVLARALYCSPDILILDEGTSALDAESEEMILSQIIESNAKQTVLFVAHRLSSIRSFNRVIYLKEGSVIGDGSFDHLVQSVPDFRMQLRLLGLLD